MVGYSVLKPHGRPMLRLSPLPINLLALDLPGATAFVSKLGWPKYRARQILRWVYQSRIRDIHQMTDLPLNDRESLRSIVTIGRCSNLRVLQSGDGTRKFLLPLEDGGALLDAADTGFMKDVKIQNNVRDISKELSKRKAKEYRWQPTPKEVDKIVIAIWPKKNVARRKRKKLIRIPISQKNQPQKNEEG